MQIFPACKHKYKITVMNNLLPRECTKSRTLDDGLWTVDYRLWTMDNLSVLRFRHAINNN